ncbi:MAG: carbohydrate deacetylase [Thermoguttaceae bacterium]
MIRLIVNADDAGIAPFVNEAICLGSAQNVISAASLMTNMPFAKAFIEEVRANNLAIDIGLHFCLTSGKALTSPEKIPLLVSPDGCFRHSFVSLWRQLASQNREKIIAQIEVELAAQLKWCDDHEVNLRFFDSHQHIHAIPGLFELCQIEAAKRQIYLRIPDESFVSFLRFRHRCFAWFPGGIARKMILSLFLKQYRKNPNQSDSIAYFGVLDTGQFRLPAWFALFESLAGSIHSDDLHLPKNVLVNIHPATRFDPTGLSLHEADERFWRSTARFGEWQDVMSETFQKWSQQFNVHVTRFSEIYSYTQN